MSWDYTVEPWKDKWRVVAVDENAQPSSLPVARWDYFEDKKEAHQRADYYRNEQERRKQYFEDCEKNNVPLSSRSFDEWRKT